MRSHLLHQIIGGLGMLDDGSDWKIIAVRTDSVVAAEVEGGAFGISFN
jgi:inorganic pyrophosphatase